MKKEVPAAALLDWPRSDSDRSACAIIGIPGGTGSRWRLTGRMLTVEEAETFCDRLRIHPTEVWPDWYDYVSRV